MFLYMGALNKHKWASFYSAPGMLITAYIRRIQAELLYSFKGLKGVQRSPYHPEYKYGFDFHYLELPLLMRLGLSNNFRIGAGPSIACLVKGKETTEKHSAFDLKHTLTSFDFGLHGDLSYAFRRFEISSRYTQGLHTVDQKWVHDAEISGSVEKILKGKNRTFQIGVAYVLLE